MVCGERKRGWGQYLLIQPLFHSLSLRRQLELYIHLYCALAKVSSFTVGHIIDTGVWLEVSSTLHINHGHDMIVASLIDILQGQNQILFRA